MNDKREALWKGVSLDADDLLRREVIKALICNFQLDKHDIEQRFDLDFNTYFAEDLELLQTFINDELVTVDERYIQVELKGRLLIRNICMCFDKYLRDRARQQQFLPCDLILTGTVNNKSPRTLARGLGTGAFAYYRPEAGTI